MLAAFLLNHNNKDNEAAIRKIYEEHYGLMRNIANGILKNHTLAENVVPEALVKINNNLRFNIKHTVSFMHKTCPKRRRKNYTYRQKNRNIWSVRLRK